MRLHGLLLLLLTLCKPESKHELLDLLANLKSGLELLPLGKSLPLTLELDSAKQELALLTGELANWNDDDLLKLLEYLERASLDLSSHSLLPGPALLGR